ncbi:cytochrome b5-like heme/steroid binding domain-containing protein [Xylogone sp. PMI_703]|nr:cytochrome b5-like heme/steroid binding domain-containing protein [Xylogone sp. PMI_703]
MSRTYTWMEINTHNKPNDLYLVICNKLYDVTAFQHEHPGGLDLLIDQGGKDVTDLFDDAGHSNEAKTLLESLQIGSVEKYSSIKFSTPTGETSENETQPDDLGSSFHLFMTILVILVSYTSFFYYQSIEE